MRFNDAVIGVGLILFAIVVIFLTRDFPTLKGGYPGPSLFPNVLAFLFMISGGVLIYQGLRSKKPFVRINQDISFKGLANCALVLTVILLYILFSEKVGFLIISSILLFVMMRCFRGSLGTSLVAATGITLGIYLLFAKILYVPLPSGFLGW